MRFIHQTPASGAEVLSTEAIKPDHGLPPSMLNYREQGFKPSSILSHREQSLKPGFYKAVAEIMELRSKYIRDRFVFVEGAQIIPIIRALGATDKDIETLPQTSESLYQDPTLPFRRSRNGRFCFDYETQSVRRLEFQPFVLSAEEDFKRYDSGQVRIFDEIENEVQLNTAFQAMLVFKGIMMNGVQTLQRPNLDYSRNRSVCTLFHLRTVTTPEMLGEPALEGVHTDGVDHTMTTFVGSNNMAPRSAATFLHDMQETTGSKLNETTPELVIGRVQHRNFLDTLMIVDNERKHSISPVYAVEPSKEATRDMFIFFTRRPTTPGHVSAGIDSFKPHLGKPMEVPLFVPQSA
jgi:hypothetical protein